MSWPQWTVLFLFGLQVVVAVCKHGEPRKWDGIVAFVDVFIFGLLLWFGGFFA
jgi:hypothetical protein